MDKPISKSVVRIWALAQILFVGYFKALTETTT